jgi:hypothetical protein
MPVYVATLRAIFQADDEVEANVIAEVVRENAAQDLDEEEDGDEVILTQLVPFDSKAMVPEELLVRLAKSRNDLIRTRYIECWNIAKELDKVIYIIRRNLIGNEFMLADYDYGHFIKVSEEVLTNGGDPHD